MKTKFTVITPSGEELPVEIDLPAEPSWDDMKRALSPWFNTDEGTWPEHVNVLGPDEKTMLDMFVDENGHSKGLPMNAVATEHYMRNVQVAKRTKKLRLSGSFGEAQAYIVGTAVLYHRKVWF